MKLCKTELSVRCPARGLPTASHIFQEGRMPLLRHILDLLPFRVRRRTRLAIQLPSEIETSNAPASAIVVARRRVKTAGNWLPRFSSTKPIQPRPRADRFRRLTSPFHHHSTMSLTAWIGDDVVRRAVAEPNPVDSFLRDPRGAPRPRSGPHWSPVTFAGPAGGLTRMPTPCARR